MKIVILTFVLIVSIASYGQDNFTKDHFKALKKTLPKGLIVKPNYFDKYVSVSTGKIVFNGKRQGEMDEQRTGHTWRFYLYYIDGKWSSSQSITYIFEYRASNWLFIDNLDILLANSNKESRQGIGEHIKVDLSEAEQSRNVISGGNIEERYYLKGGVTEKWLGQISQNGYFSRIKVYGKDGFVWEVLDGANFQEMAKSFLKVKESNK